MTLKKLTLGFALLALGLTTSAQQTLRLSLADAQQYAIEHNQAMKNADLDIKKAEWDRWKTLSSMLPTVKAGYDYQNMCGYKMEMHMGGTAINIPMDPTGSLSVTAAIALTGSQIVGTMLQNLALEMTDISRQQTVQQTRSQVKNVYVSILIMEQTAGLLDSSLANLERLAATSQSAVDVGAAEQLDADSVGVDEAYRCSVDHSPCALHSAHLGLQGGDVGLGVGERCDVSHGHRSCLAGVGSSD